MMGLRLRLMYIVPATATPNTVHVPFFLHHLDPCVKDLLSRISITIFFVLEITHHRQLWLLRLCLLKKDLQNRHLLSLMGGEFESNIFALAFASIAKTFQGWRNGKLNQGNTTTFSEQQDTHNGKFPLDLRSPCQLQILPLTRPPTLFNNHLTKGQEVLGMRI